MLTALRSSAAAILQRSWAPQWGEGRPPPLRTAGIVPAFFPHLCFSFSDPRHLLDDCRSSHPTTPPNTGNYLAIRHRMGAQMLEFAAFPQHMVDARDLILQTVWASLWNWQLVDFGRDGRCHHAASDHSNSVAICLMKELADLVHDFLRDLDSFCTGHDGVTAAGFQPSVELLHPPQLSEFMKKSFKSVSFFRTPTVGSLRADPCAAPAQTHRGT